MPHAERGLAGIVLVSLAILAVRDARAWPGGSLPPRRDDIVARFTSGTVLIDVAGATTRATIRGGRMSLSTDDVRCVPSASAACGYTVNDVRLMTPGFVVLGQTFDDVRIVSGRRGFDQLDDGTGIHVRPVLPFWVFGRMSDQDFGLLTTPDLEHDVLTVMDLVVTPTANHATLYGVLSGTIDTLDVRVTIMASADEPFENVPPLADAGPEVSVSTSCIGELSLDASGTTDPNGNLGRAWWEVDGSSIGPAGEPIALPAGDHVLTLVAPDDYGARSTDTTLAHVRDDGTSPPLPGADVVAFEVPRGTVPETFAIAASRALTLMPGAEVISDTGSGAPVASLGSLAMGVGAHAGDTYAVRGALLQNRAWVEGALHEGGSLARGRDVRIDGGVARDGPYSPASVTSFYVPELPADAPDVRVGPGEDATLDPGGYASLALGPRARLALAPGVYVVGQLEVAPNATLVTSPQADGAPTILAVTEEVFYHGTVASTASRPSLLVAYLGSEPWTIHTGFEGWVVAPHAELVLGGAEHHGAFVAAEVRVSPHARVRHAPLPWDFVRGARLACALEPRVTCVREEADTFVAVFGYTNALAHLGATVPVGTFNRLIGADQAPPQMFWPREVDEAFSVAFAGQVTWVLGGRSATATTETVRCP